MLRAIAPLFAPQVVAFTIVFGTVQAAEAGVFGDAWRSDDGGSPIEWGGQTHATPEGLAQWLRERGASYPRWAKRHPQAAVQLERAGAEATQSDDGDSLVPLGTSTLVLMVMAFASVSLLAATARFPRGGRGTGAARPPGRTRPRKATAPPVPAAAASALSAAPQGRRLTPVRGAEPARRAGLPGISVPLSHPSRFDVVFWTTGIAASLLLGLLAARLL